MKTPNKEDDRFWGEMTQKDGVKSIPFFHDDYERELEAAYREREQQITQIEKSRNQWLEIAKIQEQQIKKLEAALKEITEVPPIIAASQLMFLIAKQALKK